MAWRVMAGGAISATTATIQTRSRASFMSTPAIIEDFQQLVDLGLPVALGAGMEGMRHAVLQVIAQDLLLDLVERGLYRADLGQHVDAVAVLLDHAGDAAHLALDAAKPRPLGLLQVLVHGLNHTPVGYR